MNMSHAADGASHADVYARWVDVAVAAEELGFWSVWTTEHHFASDRTYRPFLVPDDEYRAYDYDLAADPLALLAYAAAKTSRIRLGTGVVVLNWDHPLRVVERAAMVDVLSGGRLELGVGRGAGFREVQSFGVPADQGANARRFRECVEIIRTAWAGTTFHHDGEFFSFPPLALLPRPVQQPAPIWIGSASNESAAWAGSEGLPYATITWPLTGIDRYQEKRRIYLEAAAGTNRDVSGHAIPHFLYTHCSATDERAGDTAYHYMKQFQYINEQHYEFARQSDEERLLFGAKKKEFGNVDALARYPVEHQLVGSAATIVERIRSYQEAVGLNYLVMNVGFGGMPHDETIASLERIAEEVLPAFDEAAPEVSAGPRS